MKVQWLVFVGTLGRNPASARIKWNKEMNEFKKLDRRIMKSETEEMNESISNHRGNLTVVLVEQERNKSLCSNSMIILPRR